MSAHPSLDLESVAIQRFHQRWRDKALRVGEAGGEMHRIYSEAASVSWLLRDLVLLIAEECHHPVQEIEPTIRRMVAEHEFVQAADSPDVSDETIHERLIETLLEVLEDVRRLGRTEGQFSNSPASVPMAG